LKNSSSRIYTNSDWIYGSQAWTNNPDFYIPSENKIKTNSFSVNNYSSRTVNNNSWYNDNNNIPEPYNT
jgi:PhoPQ-activated pathogenicity-related protein